MTNPGPLGVEFEKFPTDVASLSRIAQGLLIHSEWLSAYGVKPETLHIVSRLTLPVEQRLATLLELENRSLSLARLPVDRSVGTCRDFALTLCSFLRVCGIAARIRCGFAAYFHANWEDHWVCEYWDPTQATWLLADAQLDETMRRRLNITFNTSDIPRDAFLTAGEAWAQCRHGSIDPERFGHGTTTGLWFVGVNVIRDGYALHGRETSAWDTWREAAAELRTYSVTELPELDEIARSPEATIGERTPPWLALVQNS